MSLGGAPADKPFDICQRTFAFGVQIVKFCVQLNRTPGVNWAVANQLVRAGTSIGANVEEAQAGQSRADFASKYGIALKESRETNYWLRLLIASGLTSMNDTQPLVNESHELVSILTAIVKKVKRTK
ncbi:MAG: four helix bundle protein [Pirellulales bacterium]